jgi:hypothetical protein
MKKLWLITILALLLMPFLGTTTASAQTAINKKVTFGADGIALKDAFQQLEKLSGLSISYNNSTLNDKRTVRFAKAERTVQETLELLLRGTNFTFRLSGDNGILIIASSQGKGRIEGKILDEKGEPLPGASIRVPAAGVSAVAVTDGSFSLSVDAGTYNVEVSFISFETIKKADVSVRANATTNLNIALKPSAAALTEVVVTALGIKREEKALGYAATSVKGEQLTNAISGNWTDALSGKVAGLNLIRSNSGPAGSNKIILRGENNLTGDNEALIVVDGVVINQGSGRRTANAGETAYGVSSDIMPADYGSNLNDLNPERY